MRNKLIQALSALNIPYRDSGNAINVCCPYCLGTTHGRHDDKFRCGIFVSTLRFHCFRCHRTGPLVSLLRAIADVSHTEYERLFGVGKATGDSLADKLNGILNAKRTEAKEEACKPVSLPPSTPVDSQAVRNCKLLAAFLRSRKIGVETCQQYGARYTGPVGGFPFRLILPVEDEHGRLVAWQGRDLTGKAPRKYLTEGAVTEVLYWTPEQDLSKPVYLVEGVLDCWRMGSNACASFSHQLHVKQRKVILADKLIDKLVIAWDGDSYAESHAAACSLAPLVKQVGVVALPFGADPDTLGEDFVKKLPVKWL